MFCPEEESVVRLEDNFTTDFWRTIDCCGDKIKE